MPITPFHGGLGLLAKGAAPRHFSFLIFCATQVVIDVESAFYLLQGADHVHRTLHTVPGATAACVLVALVARPFVPGAMRLLRGAAGSDLPPPEDVSVGAALLSAFTGVVGHLVPDAIMHGDMRPFAPFSDANPLYRVVSLATLHVTLMVMAVVGVLALMARNDAAAEKR